LKKGDCIWGAALLGIIAFLAAPATHEIFIRTSNFYPYLSGFLKFFILASMGELLAIRIVSGSWNKPKGLIWRAIIWGIVGIIITLMFVVYDIGVKGSIALEYLPMLGERGSLLNKFAVAFFTSALMNIFFGPAFMLFHRLTDTWIDCGQGKISQMVKVKKDEMLDAAELKSFVSFVIFKSIPIFWIPAHTITFMLPPEYRVLMASLLSICLGASLGFSKRGKMFSGKQKLPENSD
jgi:hypothetical protein